MFGMHGRFGCYTCAKGITETNSATESVEKKIMAVTQFYLSLEKLGEMLQTWIAAHHCKLAAQSENLSQ